MIRFECQCGKQIKVDDKYAGKMGKCPGCQKVIKIPELQSDNNIDDLMADFASEPLPKAPATAPQQKVQPKVNHSNSEEQSIQLHVSTKACPFCSEEILESAKKCKHCGEFLTKEGNNRKSHSDIDNSSSYDSETLGILILILPVAAIFLLFFWIPSMALIDRPQSKFGMIVIGTILLTAILAMMEANQLNIGRNNNQRRETGPVGWFFCFVLFWIIAYPAYLYKRSKYGLRNYCILGVLIALIFTGASLAIGAMIESSVQEFNRSLQDLQDIFR